jgi:hypothetical protein
MTILIWGPGYGLAVRCKSTERKGVDDRFDIETGWFVVEALHLPTFVEEPWSREEHSLHIMKSGPRLYHEGEIQIPRGAGDRVSPDVMEQ